MDDLTHAPNLIDSALDALSMAAVRKPGSARRLRGPMRAAAAVDGRGTDGKGMDVSLLAFHPIGGFHTTPLDLTALSAQSLFAGKVVDAARDYVGVRKALAEADATVILADGEGRAEQVRTRALARVDFRETRRQDNIERIVSGAVEAAPEPTTVADAAVDPDWTAEFFNQCQDVSDAQMQTVWSKILAGEVAQPGRFSRRTLQAVRLLTKEEAEGFTRLCGYLWLGDKEGIFFRSPNVFPYLATKQITYGAFIHFEGIGLLSLNAARMIPHGSSLELDYHGQLFTLVPMTEPRTIPNPQFFVALLTVVGLQLALISGAEGDPQFPAIVRTSLLGDGIVLNTKESPGTQTPPQPKP